MERTAWGVRRTGVESSAGSRGGEGFARHAWTECLLAAFWFGVLYADLHLIEAGQGRAVLRARRPSWQRHLGWVFEELARAHARRLVDDGALAEDLVVGRWWSSSGPPLEVDVLGLRRSRATLVGEARWQEPPLGRRDVDALRVKAARLPNVVEDPMLAFWSRGGLTVEAENVTSFGLAAALGE